MTAISSAQAGDQAGYTGAPPPEAFNMARYVIGQNALRQPNKIALEVYNAVEAPPCEVWTYGDLDRACLKTAAALIQLGLEPGDRLVIQLPNTSLYAIAFFAATAAGLIPIPASQQLTPPEVAFLLDDSGARAILTDNVLPDDAGRGDAGPDGAPRRAVRISPGDLNARIKQAEPATHADTNANDPAYLIYTSGTTSHPKGVLHAHRAAWGRRPMYDGWYGLREADRMMHAGAFNWTYTLGTGLTDPWVAGATAIIFTGEKSPQVWPQLIAASRATIFAAVPGLYRQILKYAHDNLQGLTTLRHGLMAGETPPATLIEDWWAATGTGLYEALGMSEMSTYISTAPGVPPKPGFVGRPQPGRCVAILPVEGGETPLPPGHEGLLAVHRSDPGLMLGYWYRREEEADVMRGDWFIGGDLAVMDGDGYVAHRGRANDVIKALGYRVSPMEVEAALSAHPKVGEVACAELEVRQDVRVVAAFIVPTARHDPPSEAELDAYAKDHLASYKQPRLYRILDALPRTANGKILRRKLADHA